MKGSSSVIVELHRHDGVFIAKRKDDALCTRNLVSRESIYGEKRVVVQAPGTQVLYLGAASGTTMSHISDIVRPLSFHLGAAGILLTWQRSERMSSPALTMQEVGMVVGVDIWGKVIEEGGGE
ncbi:rRNA 2'-O-methyltransferase fibrillarin 1-like [Dioscorea cayenensis subsp. rotundata]|uniref:rRNA 2'-O-methyltransferase fibrillarin 1-like n=1 Tax=Dioscorea cayennensis subsp. rotundata TaxID=55577 RepID=A0AB40B1T7_DIOCR|nr:rRNA 2'-O-methyltransferase fibrillarin 1-like [Dioscorea cayenensis subsp. rotundata]